MGSWMRWRLLGACLALGLLLRLPVGGAAVLATTPAQACGIGFTVTMLADGQPALAYPATTQATNAPIGVFALNYVTATPIRFTEDVSRLPTPIDVGAFTWHWDFGDGTQGVGFTITHAYATPGTYTIHVKVTTSPAQNLAALSDFDSAQVTVGTQQLTQPPTATAQSSARYVQLAHPVVYTALNVQAFDGSRPTLTWNFGDGTTATGAKVTHTFTQVGDGAVTLIVQDGRGARATIAVPVTIVAELPIVRVEASARQISSAGTVTFDASASTAPPSYPNNRIARFVWDFGDGTTKMTLSPRVSHTFVGTGTFTVTVQALDRRDIPGSATITVDVTNPPLVTAAWWFSVALIVGSALYLAFLAGRRLRQATQP